MSDQKGYCPECLFSSPYAGKDHCTKQEEFDKITLAPQTVWAIYNGEYKACPLFKSNGGDEEQIDLEDLYDDEL